MIWREKTLFVFICVIHRIAAGFMSSITSLSNTQHIQYTCIRTCQSAVIPEKTQAKQNAMTSSFWYARNNTIDDKISSEDYFSRYSVPCDPYFDDGDGPLMPSAYRIFPQSMQSESYASNMKQVCLMTIGLDFERKAELDGLDMVKRVQTCIDHGFNSFQIVNSSPTLQKWGEDKVYGLLQHHTPKTVLDKCILSARLSSPPSESWNAQSVRNEVSDALIRTRSECLDLVQLPCT